ncbi:MAG: oligoendopeptidase F family protein, partial [Tissierellia bacterium]|nr:oligoendopeptidase F family protein [Tissierellia bacterium]
APSTCNELFLTDYLFEKEDSIRNKRYVVASFLGNTYYHNFVTHFLEAYFQKQVYDSLDEGRSLTTQDLHQMKKEVLEKFWGDSVVIDDKAGYTWMRQPHYYMGLYPYTYSAGLSLATNAYLRIKSGELSTQVWLDFLKAGGTKTPVELAQVLDIDLYDNSSLKASISYVEGLVDELINLSKELEE